MLKIRLTGRAINCKDGLARGFRRLLGERVDSDHGIAFNDQPLLLGAGFTLSALMRDIGTQDVYALDLEEP